MTDAGRRTVPPYQPVGRLAVGGGGAEPEASPVLGASFRVAAYRPDSTVDSWAAGPFMVRGASVRGDAHRYRGVARQDEMCLAWQDEAKLLVVAVADGVSSAPLSHVGASTVCRYAVERLLREGAGAGTPDWRDVLEGCAWALVDTWQRLETLPEPDPAEAERQLATTICVAVLGAHTDGAVVRGVAVGDSGIAMVREDRIVPLLGGKAPDTDGIRHSGVTPLPRVPDDPATGEWPLPVGETLLIGTDGVWDPIGDGQGLVAEFLVGALGRSLPHRLDFLRVVDFCRDTFDDDRTLVAVRLREDLAADEPASL